MHMRTFKVTVTMDDEAVAALTPSGSMPDPLYSLKGFVTDALMQEAEDISEDQRVEVSWTVE